LLLVIAEFCIVKIALSLNRLLKIYLLLTVGHTAAAQVEPDTLRGQSDEIIVTATRTERRLGNVAVPVLLIGQKEIAATQLRRLQEVLQEQTGIFVTNGSGSGSFGGGIFGNGAQLQGLSPDYTLILINGEPIVGRQGGTVNLSRLTVNNIRKIEIIKGPSSSLYGSDAMGGVINIITDMPLRSGFEATAKAGGYGLGDYNLQANHATQNTRVQVAYNHHRMGAIDYNPSVYGNQQDAFNNHTAQINLSHRFSPRTRLLTYGRFFSERATNQYEVFDANIQAVRVGGTTTIGDYNLNTSLQHQFSAKVFSTFRVYYTRYNSLQQLNEEKTGNPFYEDRFNQQFLRLENQTDIGLGDKHKLVTGGGFVGEYLNTSRYAGMRSNTIGYAFVQHEWNLNPNLNMVSGLRFDGNEVYASRLSPKFAVRYNPSEKLKLMASYGAGFKAPDFRQLYLSFINNASGGYALFGANEINAERLLQLQQQGIVGSILPRAADMAPLSPETSHGINVGVVWNLNSKLQAEINLFNNDLSGQIIFDVVALRPNGSQVFTYFNVNRSFTRGGEVNVRYQLTPALQLSGGYQLLFSGDKAVMENIREGQVFGREQGSGTVYKLSTSDYLGLPGRSRHMANLKLFYTGSKGWQASLRAVYRSRWGTFDQDGNGIINRPDETAKGFVMLNAGVQKQINQQWLAGAGVENILNHRDAVNLPNIAGINAFVSVGYRFQKENKKPINK